MNTVLRRTALSLTLLPATVVAMIFSIVFIGPLFVFFAWASGSKHPFSEAYRAVVSEGPMQLFVEAWNGSL